MEPAEHTFIIVLVILNLFLGFGLAVPIAKLLRKAINKPNRTFRYLVILIGIYFLECVAFSAGMATQVFSIGLAFVWGIVFGLWFRKYTLSTKALKTSFLLALYTCLPTASFGVLLLISWLVSGNSILSVESGSKLGIPNFVPWPLNTVLGFCMALIIGTVLFKIVITTGEVSVLINLGRKSGYDNFKHTNF